MTTVDSASLGKAVRVIDAPGRYIEFCKASVSSEVSLSGLRIVVDCANGAAYHIAPDVFSELGADVVELGVQPDGLNINLACGATHTQYLQEAVLRERADLGIALDGDADRLILVDGQGKVVDGDDILYIIARHKLETHTLKGGVVGTVMSNLGLEQALNKLGIPFVRTAVGDRHVVSALRKRGWQVGGEPSGHIICSDTMNTGDGIVTALQVLAAMQQRKVSLKTLKSGWCRHPQMSVSVGIGKARNEGPFSAAIQAALQEAELKMGPLGRVLLRRSGTEPVMRIMVEGKEEFAVQETANWLAGVIRQELA